MTLALPLGHELEAERRFRVIGERNVELSMEMSFLICPYYALTIVPKNGMNPIRILSA